MSTVLITGASRGLGLEFARAYAAEGWKVIATCRHPDQAADLRGLPGDISIRPLDVAQTAQIEALAAELAGVPIDVLINNAGMHGPRNASGSFGATDLTA